VTLGSPARAREAGPPRGFHPYRMMYRLRWAAILVAVSSRGAWHMEGFHEGQKVWVSQADGSQRPGVFVGDAEIPGSFGGPPAAYVVYPDTRSGEEVSLLQITPREE